MVVSCPKCKTRLKVDETKLPPAGSRFKCPRCATVLLVKKPAPQQRAALNSGKVLVAHSRPEVAAMITSLIASAGYEVVTATDGIEVMVKALKEMPFLAVVEVALPKIYGFEVCKRLKSRAETKEMKFVLVPSINDRTKYRREPVSFYGADEYLEEHDMQEHLVEKINLLRDGGKKEEEAPPPPRPAEPPAATRPPQPEPQAAREPAPAPAAAPSGPAPSDEKVEKASRLARTIINDIYLYNVAKVDEAIRSGDFYTVFASEVKEGLKLYEHRIPVEVRNQKDYYREAIDNFIAGKKKALGL